jgi:exopolysaccharide production protein ExoZ
VITKQKITANRINNLQVLRAFAAINVVVFHAIGAAAGYGMPVHYFKPLEGWGINGVDIFFVISGFMMAEIGLQKNPTPFHFIWDRIKRICPTYYFWTAVMMILSLSIPQILNNQHIDKLQYIATPLFLSQLLAGKFPVIFVGWTLEYEMLFYVIFAACLFIKNVNQALWLCLTILAALVFIGLSRPLILEFGFGIVVAIVLRRFSEKIKGKLAWPSFWLGLISLLATLILRPDPQTPYLLVMGYGIPAMVLVFGLVTIPQIQNRFSILIGNASYSIYLVQVLVLPAVFKLVTTMSDNYRAFADLVVLFGVLATTAVGIASYFTIELTAKHWLSRGRIQTTSIAKA